MSIYKDKLHKLPRLYINNPIIKDDEIDLDSGQAHYLKNVIRKNINDYLRIFNGKDGEWVVNINSLSKKNCSVLVVEQIREQNKIAKETHLFFAPIKKNRMDWVIEKSVELGVTHFHPVITANTENRKLNISRIEKQILEASEQCERLDVPKILDPEILSKVLSQYDDIEIFAAIERMDVETLGAFKVNNYSIGYLTGPEGGFTSDEVSFLDNKENVTPVSLGDNILRAETAIIYGVSILSNCREESH